MEELRAEIKVLGARLDSHRNKILELEARVHLLNLERAMDAPVREKANATPKPNTGPSELVKMVRDAAIDPMFRALYGKGELSEPTWRGTNAYAKDAILAVAEFLEQAGFAGTAGSLRAHMEP